jgi:hypothetical protein
MPGASCSCPAPGLRSSADRAMRVHRRFFIDSRSKLGDTTTSVVDGTPIVTTTGVSRGLASGLSLKQYIALFTTSLSPVSSSWSEHSLRAADAGGDSRYRVLESWRPGFPVLLGSYRPTLRAPHQFRSFVDHPRHSSKTSSSPFRTPLRIALFCAFFLAFTL